MSKVKGILQQAIAAHKKEFNLAMPLQFILPSRAMYILRNEARLDSNGEDQFFSGVLLKTDAAASAISMVDFSYKTREI